VSDDAKDFIRRLLMIDPGQRLTAKEALKHKWVTGNAPQHELKSTFKEKFSKYVHLRKAESKVLTEDI
jgi:calcium/calmodulin-dependent protein kinase I